MSDFCGFCCTFCDEQWLDYKAHPTKRCPRCEAVPRDMILEMKRLREQLETMEREAQRLMAGVRVA